MSDSKLFFTMMGLFVAVFAVCNLNKPKTKENFWGLPGRTTKVFREVHPTGTKSSCGSYSLQNNYQAMLGNSKFVSYPKFQGILSPRFDNNQYSASIRYNAPDYKNMASPSCPLTFGNMVKEDYKQVKEDYGCGGCGGCGSCGVASCAKGGLPQLSIARDPKSAVPPSYSSGNFDKVARKAYSSNTTQPMPSSLIPVGDMTTINQDGQVAQHVVYDRLMFANQNSRLRAQGDPIRGDLPIVPCNNGWFNPAVNPSVDLQEGAMNVMGGLNNGTTQALGELLYSTSAGTRSDIAGVDMSNQFSTQFGELSRTPIVTSF